MGSFLFFKSHYVSIQQERYQKISSLVAILRSQQAMQSCILHLVFDVSAIFQSSKTFATWLSGFIHPKFGVESNLVWIAFHFLRQSVSMGPSLPKDLRRVEPVENLELMLQWLGETLWKVCSLPAKKKCSHHLPIRVWRVYHWYTVITIPNDRPFSRFFTTFGHKFLLNNQSSKPEVFFEIACK